MEKRILLYLLVMMLHSIEVLNTAFDLSIMHAIPGYWPQSVKQMPKSQTRLIHRNCWVSLFHIKVADSTQLECARSADDKQ